ncbi:MAG: tetratricopeptide repeat protein [Bacillota bacterium]|nr:tetratricopeptide repeat protein [Bacillota bacterium]
MFIVIAICWIALFIALGIWMIFDRKDNIQALKDLDYYLTFDPEDENILRVRERINALKNLSGFMACIDFGFAFVWLLMLIHFIATN